MKLAITQPCFFPYEGYFNMIEKVDKVIFLDDVFYTSKDWINKTILNGSNKHYYFRVPLERTEQNRLIKDTKTANHAWKKRFTKVINFNYKFKKNYPNVAPIIKEVLDLPTENIAQIAAYSVFKISDFMGIAPRHAFTFSSQQYDNINTNYVDKLIQICKKEKATEFWALPYLRNTLDPKTFLDNSIRLNFIDSNYPKHSIIDKIMDESAHKSV